MDHKESNDTIVAVIKEEGNKLFQSGQYQKAIDKYSEGITIDPTNAKLYCNRAAAYSELNPKKYVIPVVKDCEKAIELDPNYAKAYYRLAKISQQHNCIGKAVLNYQRSVNCSNSNHALCKKCKSEITNLQKKGTLTSQAHVLHYQEQMALKSLRQDGLKRKYKNEIFLQSFGHRAEQVADYSGPEQEGEIEMSLYEILNDGTMVYQAVMMDPEMGVKLVDELLKNAQSYQGFCNKENAQNSGNTKKKNKRKVCHKKKYAKMSELKEQKKELEQVMIKANKDELHLKSTFGQMVFNLKREIQEIENAINRNESDQVWQQRCEEQEWNPEFMDNIFGVPDVMAKRLLFEYRMLPWDENAEITIAKMNNW